MAKFNLDEFEFEEKTVNSKKSNTKKEVVEEPVQAKNVASMPVKSSSGKMPMMNIRFSPENSDYMRREAAIRGLSVIKFTNWIIDQYRQDPNHVHVNDLYLNEENW